MHIFIKEHKYFMGSEYDWGAVDTCGQLACFSSAGFGPIPQFCNERPDEEELDLLDAIFEMPIVTTYKQVSGFDCSPADSFDIAKRGIYSYDWCHTKKQYELIALPKKPIFRRHIQSELTAEFLKIEFDWVFEEKHKSGIHLEGVEIK